jgi:hypothetical protein
VACSNTVTLSATDGTNSASLTFAWAVAGLALDGVADRQDRDGASVSLQLSVTDVGGTPTYSASGLPSGVSLNASTGLISGTVGLAAHGSSPYAVTISAHDGSASDSLTFVWAVSPRVVVLNPGPQLDATGDTVSLGLTGSTPTGTLTWAASGLPSGLSVVASSGLITGTLASGAAQADPYGVTVTATDGGATNSLALAWSVASLALRAPGDQSNLDLDSVSLALSALYNGTATLSFSGTGLPTGLTLNASTGLIAGTVAVGADADGPFDVTLTVAAGTLTATQELNWAVAPRIDLGGAYQANVGGDTVSLDLSGTDAASGTLTYSLSGAPSGVTVVASSGLVTGTISASAVSGTPYTVTLNATDGVASVSTTFAWAVAGLGLTDPGPLSSVKGQSVSMSLQGRAADGGALTWAATGLPAGVTLDASTGLLHGAAITLGSYLVDVTASEGGSTVSEAVSWRVLEVGMSQPADQSGTEGDTVSLALSGASASGGSLTWVATGLPDGLSVVASSGLITGTLTPGAAADGPFEVQVFVSDGTARSSGQFAWAVAPYVSLAPVTDQSNLEGDTVSLALSATDAGAHSLTFTATGLPSGVSMNSSTGVVSGTVAAGAALAGPTCSVEVSAADGTYSTTQGFQWALRPSIAPAAPSLTNPGAQANQTGDPVVLQLAATDAAGYSLSWSADGLPDGVDIDPSTGLISGTVSDVAASEVPWSVTVAVDDGVGQMASVTFLWAVSPSPITVSGVSLSATAGADTGTIIVGTFTTSDPESQEGDFRATVTWGDGTTDDGVITGNDRIFTITAEHVYEQTGGLTLGITVENVIDGGITSSTGIASVSAASWTLSGGLQEGTIAGEGAAVLVGTVQDGDPALTAADFSASIDPGDGGSSVAGAVQSLGDGLWGVYLPSSYSYGQVGTYTASLTVTGPDGTHTASSTVVAGHIYAGVQSMLTVAQFDVGDSSAVASGYAATINWGDGTPSASGTVSGTGGVFTVMGSHAYAVDSYDETSHTYPVSVTLTKAGQTVLTASHNVEVVRPPMKEQMGNVMVQADGSLPSQTLATFEVPNGTDGATEFAATIDWGDGTTSSGTVTGSNGLFKVAGGHTYVAAGDHVIRVDVSQGWQSVVWALTVAGLGVNAQKKPKMARPKYLYVVSYEGAGTNAGPWRSDDPLRKGGPVYQFVAEGAKKAGLTLTLANYTYYRTHIILARYRRIAQASLFEPQMQPGDKFMLLGYSWGGAAIISIARNRKLFGIIPMPDLAFTIDPVPHPNPRGSFRSVAGLAKRWISYYQQQDERSLRFGLRGKFVPDALNQLVTLVNMTDRDAVLDPARPFDADGLPNFITLNGTWANYYMHQYMPYYYYMLEALVKEISALK